MDKKKKIYKRYIRKIEDINKGKNQQKRKGRKRRKKIKRNDKRDWRSRWADEIMKRRNLMKRKFICQKKDQEAEI